jgi:hypothetical protein
MMLLEDIVETSFNLIKGLFKFGNNLIENHPKKYFAIWAVSTYLGFCSGPSDMGKYEKLTYLEVIEKISTPEEAQEYVQHYIDYAEDDDQWGRDYIPSFKWIHENKKEDCDGGALAACALLSDDQYVVRMASIGKDDAEFGHAICIFYEQGKGYGSIGIRSSDFREAKYNSPAEIVKDLEFDYYTTINPEDYENWIWENQKEDMFNQTKYIRANEGAPIRHILRYIIN